MIRPNMLVGGKRATLTRIVGGVPRSGSLVEPSVMLGTVLASGNTVDDMHAQIAASITSMADVATAGRILSTEIPCADLALADAHASSGHPRER